MDTGSGSSNGMKPRGTVRKTEGVRFSRLLRFYIFI